MAGSPPPPPALRRGSRTPEQLLRRALQLGLASGVLGCSSPPAPPGSQVVTPFADLAPVAAANDPLSEHRPAAPACEDLAAWYVEDDFLEVDTGRCNYLALSEPAAVAAPRGAVLTLELRHFDLTAETPAEAHLAILLRGQVLWETRLPIPSAANVELVTIELPSPMAKGDPVGFHLHNHGQNTYAFGRVTVAAPASDGAR